MLSPSARHPSPPFVVSVVRRSAPLVAAVGLVGALGGGGCRSAPPEYEPDLSPVKSGDRLRARWIANTSGDVRYFDGWYDTDLATSCEFRSMGGTFVCLPPSQTVVYRDADCTQPAVVDYACEDVAYAELPAPDSGAGCGAADALAPSRFFTVENVVDDAASVYWIASGGQCVEQAQVQPVTLRGVGEEVSMTAFVSAEVRRDYSGTRLAVDFLRTEDGAQEQFVTYDLELATPCAPDFVRSNGLCLPPTNVYTIGGGGGYFRGPDCGGEELAFSSACEPAGFVYEFVEDGACGYTSRYFALGEPWTSTVYTGSVDACLAVTDTPYTFFEVGDPLTASQFVTLDTRTVGDGRLRLTLPTYEGEVDVSVPRNPQLFDSQLEINCMASRLSDGSLRCLPSESVVNVSDVAQNALWGDATCSTTPLQTWSADSPCNPAPSWFIALDFETCGADVLEVYSRGSAHTGEVYAKDGDQCFAVSVDPTTSVYTMEGPLPVDDFAALQRIVE